MKIIERIPVFKEIAVLQRQLEEECKKLEKNLAVNGKVLRALPRGKKE